MSEVVLVTGPEDPFQVVVEENERCKQVGAAGAKLRANWQDYLPLLVRTLTATDSETRCLLNQMVWNKVTESDLRRGQRSCMS